jgi:hypothetical protein
MDKEELGKLAFDRFIAGAKSDTARDYWYNKFKQELGQEVGQGVQVERTYSVEDMRLSFETGRNFQLTGDNNFKELIEQTLEDTLNLDELESKLDAALNSETTESLTQWIKTKRNNIPSVEWLIETLSNKHIGFEMYVNSNKEIIEQANAMNQQEIVTAYQEGTKDNFNSPHFGSGLNYFRETYKK